jgi:hypothetical protein
MMFKLTLILLSMVTILAGCSDSMTSFDETVSIQDQYESQIMSLPGVVGVGIGECDREPCLKVFVTEITSELENQIPQELDGVKVDIVVTGPIEALPAPGAASTSFDAIVRVQKQYAPQLMNLPGVIGMGIGECDELPCFKVFVTEMTPELEEQIPPELDGFKVDIEVTGPVQALPGSGAAMKSFEEIVRVQEQYENQLLSLPGVVGVGIGDCDGAPCLQVFVSETTAELQDQIPQELDGVKVEIKVTGPINTLP